MKRVFLIIVGGLVLFTLSACGDQEGPGGQPAKTDPYATSGSAQTMKKADTGKGRGLGMVREPSRVLPGWESPSMPGIKSAYPGNCPGSSMPMVRKGEWTCANHPQVSGMAPGKCPVDGADLVKVADLEKEKGKSIEELMQAHLAAQK